MFVESDECIDQRLTYDLLDIEMANINIYDTTIYDQNVKHVWEFLCLPLAIDGCKEGTTLEATPNKHGTLVE